MAGQKTISTTSVEVPPEPPIPPTPLYTASVGGTPDIAGDYYETSPFNGMPTYTRMDGAYVAWWEPGANKWYITVEVNNVEAGWFESNTYDLIGLFLGSTGYVGTVFFLEYGV